LVIIAVVYGIKRLDPTNMNIPRTPGARSRKSHLTLSTKQYTKVMRFIGNVAHRVQAISRSQGRLLVSVKVDTQLETILRKMKRFKSTETEEQVGSRVLRHKVIVVLDGSGGLLRVNAT
jgi:hypothetical protein